MNETIKFDDSIIKIKGIGATKLDRLAKLNILKVRDLLNHFPVKYQNRKTIRKSKDLTEHEEQLAVGVLIKKNIKIISGNRKLVECTLRDDKGLFFVSFFNMPYIIKTLETGREYSIFGTVNNINGKKIFTNPEFAILDSKEDIRGILPVYRCTKGITSKDIRKWIDSILAETDPELEWLDERIIQTHKLLKLIDAYREIHFPTDRRKQKRAFQRIIFEELLCYQLAILRNRDALSRSADTGIKDINIKKFINDLPFTLTKGQEKAINEIEKDLISSIPMNRLLQGDVGSGKTVVAEASMYKVVSGGSQAAFLAPTELLARQQYYAIKKDMDKYGFTTEILTGGMKKKARQDLLDRLLTGETDILVGTHAILNDDVKFNDLALVVTDEQQRFGVNQRRKLNNKAKQPNTLVMSATPIPRTMTATIFGDLSYSIIDDKPKGRKDIITKTFNYKERIKVYANVKKELEKGRKTFVVVPSIESDDLSSVKDIYLELNKKFKEFNVKFLHGEMSDDDKSKIMQEFAYGDIDLLVTTVVIEVGIDVPLATVMVVENSERFGLAQLHQLRGRVGRNDLQSYCFLINYSKSNEAEERMKILSKSNDGFFISKEDHRLRGPGDLIGIMQHGKANNRLNLLIGCTRTNEAAIKDAKMIFNNEYTINEKELESRFEDMINNDNSNVL